MPEPTADPVYDVVVIGTGAAGALAAYQFQKAGLHVLMLEWGAAA
jgi:choline dehydrogenase-like flavoprotein